MAPIDEGVKPPNRSESFMEIRLLKRGEEVACEGILRALPDWFGIEEGIAHYVKALSSMETWVLETESGIAGFLTLHPYGNSAADVYVMAVSPSMRDQGLGRRLMQHAESILRDRGVEFMQVKTLAPSRPSKAYARTRGFYLKMGFRPLEENKLWGEKNPCLIMVKHLPCQKPEGIKGEAKLG
ncbi:MAG: N-acetyltransferase [Planctomycetota bacterium]|nr:MAG: N-acetyltransferase [Planctomycetota bacterium]